jgi:hypothetical protein
LLAASQEIGLEVNADKTQYMGKSGDQKTGRNHGINIGYSSFEMME